MPKFTNSGPFTLEDEDCIREFYGKLSNSDLANRMKRNFIQIRHRAVALGLEKPIQRKPKSTPPPAAPTAQADDFAAMQRVYDALKPLDNDNRKRILCAVDTLLDINWLVETTET